MLEKNAFKILGVIAAMAVEGENLVVEKKEILAQIGVEMTSEELDNNMEALEVNDMIAMRYSDGNLYCVALRPKGRMVSEKNRQASVAAAIADSGSEEEYMPEPVVPQVPLNFKKLALICGGSSFIGGFIAAIIAFLVTRFG